MFNAAKQRNPVNAGRVSFFVRGTAAEGMVTTRPGSEEICPPGVSGSGYGDTGRRCPCSAGRGGAVTD